MIPIDDPGTPDHTAGVARREVKQLIFAKSSSTIIALKTLAKNVAAHLGERAFCVVFEDGLERCWPSKRLKRAEREKEIQFFAESQGWSAVILTADSGTRQYFRSWKRVLLITTALPWFLGESNFEAKRAAGNLGSNDVGEIAIGASDPLSA